MVFFNKGTLFTFYDVTIYKYKFNVKRLRTFLVLHKKLTVIVKFFDITVLAQISAVVMICMKTTFGI